MPENKLPEKAPTTFELASAVWGSLDPSRPGLNGPRADVAWEATMVLLKTHEWNVSLRVAVGGVKKQLRERCEVPAGGEAEPFVFGTLEAMAGKLAPHLFEYDPRIGMPLSEQFPECPLFDPSLMRAGVKRALRHLQRGDAQVPRETLELADSIGKCPLCGSASVVLESVWGGGNLGFVHAECAPWIRVQVNAR